MIDRYRDGAVPEAEIDPALTGDFEGAPDRVRALLDEAQISQALDEIWKLVRRLNRYVEERRPWDLAKEEGSRGELDSVLYSLAEGLRVTTLLLVPYLPQTAERLLAALGEEERELRELGSLGGGQRIERLPQLFPKVEAEA